MIIRIGCGDVSTAVADHHDQLCLPVHRRARAPGSTTSVTGPVTEEANLGEHDRMLRDRQAGLGCVVGVGEVNPRMAESMIARGSSPGSWRAGTSRT